MTGYLFLALIVFSVASFMFGRSLARRKAAAQGVRGHSLPAFSGWFVAIWSFIPAALILFVLVVFGGRVENAIVQADVPAAVQQLPELNQGLFFQDVRATVNGGMASTTVYDGELKAAFDHKVSQAKSVDNTITLGAYALTFVLALAGAAFAYSRLSPQFRARNSVERWVSAFLVACSVVAILTTLGIILSLLWESLRFFQSVSPLDFLFGTHWSPQIAMRADQVGSSGGFGAVPLFVGTFLIMIIAMCVAAPVGLYSAIYLSEYASPFMRAWIKPVLEILAGVPTVVYGFFAALVVGPSFREFFNWLGAFMPGTPMGEYLMNVQNQMALVAGVVMGIMLIPFVSSLSDDIINSVPQSLRDGSLAMGATRSETIKKVVLPAALPGISGAMLLAVSRAVGETMIVTMAAGLQAKTTLNPLDTVTTVTVQIVTLLTGDQEFDSPKTLAAFGLGLTLFAVTLALNLIAQRIVQKYQEQYD
ncbi:phosphate ABC transporter permease subunit PstC [Asticcacaulis sp. ZE23SCel15]|uniref:phosphate ABC transporter permease subunit PstC n=1 Tax=Asticcacaulis sp. ZE23SCel15 TaxID=3059027 RepID=UPI00265E341B|nr:phosphate ABC transporter permease subunit PstC [Asticcacaulis sp. ZE23SCel15]WKL58096.1 phosphate ABC transporter permease subunit PstC [Asticcacaulis sp. ZE23SCel15]